MGHLLSCSSPLLCEKTGVLGSFSPLTWLLQDVFLIRNAWAQKYFGFQIISPFFVLCMCMHVCGYACLAMRVEPKVDNGIILYCSCTLVFKAGPLNQTQSTLIWLILLVSLLWGSRLCLLGL